MCHKCVFMLSSICVTNDDKKKDISTFLFTTVYLFSERQRGGKLKEEARQCMHPKASEIDGLTILRKCRGTFDCNGIVDLKGVDHRGQLGTSSRR